MAILERCVDCEKAGCPVRRTGISAFLPGCNNPGNFEPKGTAAAGKRLDNSVAKLKAQKDASRNG